MNIAYSQTERWTATWQKTVLLCHIWDIWYETCHMFITQESHIVMTISWTRFVSSNEPRIKQGGGVLRPVWMLRLRSALICQDCTSSLSLCSWWNFRIRNSQERKSLFVQNRIFKAFLVTLNVLCSHSRNRLRPTFWKSQGTRIVG